MPREPMPAAGIRTGRTGVDRDGPGWDGTDRDTMNRDEAGWERMDQNGMG